MTTKSCVLDNDSVISTLDYWIENEEVVFFKTTRAPTQYAHVRRTISEGSRCLFQRQRVVK